MQTGEHFVVQLTLPNLSVHQKRILDNVEFLFQTIVLILAESFFDKGQKTRVIFHVVIGDVSDDSKEVKADLHIHVGIPRLDPIWIVAVCVDFIHISFDDHGVALLKWEAQSIFIVLVFLFKSFALN